MRVVTPLAGLSAAARSKTRTRAFCVLTAVPCVNLTFRVALLFGIYFNPVPSRAVGMTPLPSFKNLTLFAEAP